MGPPESVMKMSAQNNKKISRAGRKKVSLFQRAALFDFDGTLTKRSSIVPFFVEAAGARAVGARAHQLALPAARYALGRAAFSDVFALSFQGILTGKTEGQLSEAGARLGTRLAKGGMWSAARLELLSRLEAGERVAIVTGGLPYCARGWLLAEGLEDRVEVFASSIVFDAQGKAQKIERVMVREQKLAAIEWARGQGAQRVSAFGNSEGDHAMLRAACEPWWVSKKGALSRWEGAL